MPTAHYRKNDWHHSYRGCHTNYAASNRYVHSQFLNFQLLPEHTRLIRGKVNIQNLGLI